MHYSKLPVLHHSIQKLAMVIISEMFKMKHVNVIKGMGSVQRVVICVVLDSCCISRKRKTMGWDAYRPAINNPWSNDLEKNMKNK